MRSVHPVFHISQLEIAHLNPFPDRTQPPPPPVEVDSEIEYEISEILDSKLDRRKKIQLQYYVQWAGYEGTAEEFSWVDASDLENASELVHDFHESYPNKPGPDLRFYKRPENP